jgi:hypothetical protein
MGFSGQGGERDIFVKKRWDLVWNVMRSSKKT